MFKHGSATLSNKLRRISLYMFVLAISNFWRKGRTIEESRNFATTVVDHEGLFPAGLFGAAPKRSFATVATIKNIMKKTFPHVPYISASIQIPVWNSIRF